MKYRKRTKRVKRVRRAKRWRRKFRKSGSYDGVMKIKVHGTYDLIYSSTVGHADLVINWAGNGSANSTTTARLTVTNEMTTFSPLYNEYRVVGMKYRIMPISEVTSSLGSGLFNILIGTDTGPTLPNRATADNQLLSYCDFKEYQFKMPITKYINVGKYYAKRNVKWITTAQNYPDVGTLIRAYGQGYSDLNVMGKVHVTWYVKWKGPQL